MIHHQIIAQELQVAVKQVESTINLLDEGGTVPFISRYRKEITGSLDEVQIAAIRDRIQQLRELDKRRTVILNSLEEMGKLTDELKMSILSAETMAVLEDLYLPYKPKRKTRASVAKEKGLEPLALLIFEQELFDVLIEAEKYINEEKGAQNVEEVLAGARDIIAEMVSENAQARAEIRKLFLEKGTVKAQVFEGKEELGTKYKDYFDFEESLKIVPSHRLLAIRRAEKEEILKLDILPSDEEAIIILNDLFLKAQNEAASEVQSAVLDGYKRLLRPSIETEVRLLSKQKADEEAIRVFAENARQLLLVAPMGQKTVLAIDPGLRTGCKTVCLDPQGKLLENTTIFPNNGVKGAEEAASVVRNLCKKYQIEAIAIGNGTAGRETERFIRSLQLENILVVSVNESGASIYSASEVAREEFPDKDVTVRGAVSIGRRLMDPLAELVKIDPKSIGVGQYQHDVDQNKLQVALDDTVVSVVNAVGVELNTASKQILAYVSGLGPSLAQNIVQYRNENGAFASRNELKKVSRLGDKAYEQCVGFLRIRNGKHPLDASAVHPERYGVVETMAKDLGCEVVDLMQKESLRKQIQLQKYVSDEVGLPTLNDIISELAKPGRDPREQFEHISFTDGVNQISDLRIGMQLNGIVTNITNFGAFVDIGVHQDGLVHTSQLANHFVQNASDVVKVHQKVKVTVLEVDTARKRISLSMKDGVTPIKKTKAVAPQGKKQREQQAESDLQTKLAQLKSMFK